MWPKSETVDGIREEDESLFRGPKKFEDRAYHSQKRMKWDCCVGHTGGGDKIHKIDYISLTTVV